MPSLEQFSVRSSSPGSDSSAFFADLRCFGNSVLEGKMRIIVVPGMHGTGTLSQLILESHALPALAI